jgi:hypothetical protein
VRRLRGGAIQQHVGVVLGVGRLGRAKRLTKKQEDMKYN